MSFISGQEEKQNENEEDEWDLDHVYDNEGQVDNEDTPPLIETERSGVH